MLIKEGVTATLHPTELYNTSSGVTALADRLLLSIPTCRRPPLGLFSSASIFPTSPTHHSIPFYTNPSRMDTDEDGVTDYIELQGWDVIVIHERRGEVMEDRCEYGVWSLPIRYDSEGDGASDETEWKFHGNPDSSDSDKDGIPDREESGPNLTMVEGTPPVILDKKGRDKSSDKYSGAYIKTKVKVKTKWSISGVKIKGKIIVIFTVVDNAGLDRAVIYVQTGGERIIYLGGDKRREIEEVFDIGDLLRLIHGGYDVRVNVTDINGNWATGKTHIDSALQTLKKGLMALLEILKAVAKIIAKVASMLIDVVKNIIKSMLHPLLKSAQKMIKTYVLGVFSSFRSSWDKYISTRRIDSSLLVNAMFSNYKVFFLVLVGVILSVSVISTAILGVGSIVVVKPIVITIILSTFRVVASKHGSYPFQITNVKLGLSYICKYIIERALECFSNKRGSQYTGYENRGSSIPPSEERIEITNQLLLDFFFDVFSVFLSVIGLAIDSSNIFSILGFLCALISIFLIMESSFSLLTNTYDAEAYSFFSAILAVASFVLSVIGLITLNSEYWLLGVLSITLGLFVFFKVLAS